MYYTRRLVLSALFLAVGILLPIFFHFVSMSGNIFLPMHIPVLLGGLFLGCRGGLLLGLITPFLSSLLTGMPLMLPMTPMMMVELGVYGGLSGWLYRQKRLPLLGALLLAMLAGRMAVAGMLAVCADLLGIHAAPLVYIGMALLHGLPGIVLQLIFIPLLMKYLERSFRFQDDEVESIEKN